MQFQFSKNGVAFEEITRKFLSSKHMLYVNLSCCRRRVTSLCSYMVLGSERVFYKLTILVTFVGWLL